MSIPLGKIRLRVHPLLPLLWCFAFAVGIGNALIPAFLAFLLHEGGHLLAARIMKIPVSEIEITPFGGVITLENETPCRPMQRFILALAGPLASLMGCLFSSLLYRSGTISFDAAAHWARANVLLFLINLLPVLPLDGGQMLLSALSHFFPIQRTRRLLTAASWVVGLSLCMVTLYFACQGKMILSPAFAGLYLAYAASVEEKQTAGQYITALIARRQRLDRGQILPVEALAAGADTPVFSLLRRMNPHKYHIIYVLSADGMRRVGMLEESAFCEAILTEKASVLGDIIQTAARQNAEPLNRKNLAELNPDEK